MEYKNSYHIQLLRGLAIIAVVLIHNTPLGYCQVFVRPFLNFSVGMFLFLSGMLSGADRWNPKKRIRKVLIPYVIWTFVYVVLNNRYNLSAVPKRFVIDLLTANGEGMLYYIFLYCEFTLLIPVIDKLARSRYRYLGFLLSPLEILFLRTIPLVTQWYVLPDWFYTLRHISCVGWFTYFYLGYLLGNGYLTLEYAPKKWVGLLAVSLPVQMLEGWYLLSLGVENCGTQMKISTVFTGVCTAILAYWFVMSKKTRQNRVLKLLGDNSFAIYFSHIAVMYVLAVIPMYSRIVIYPVNAAVVLAANLMCVFVGKKICGKYAKYLAL